ncbi:nuclear transport factor 2 family protein [Thalassotalea fusca]
MKSTLKISNQLSILLISVVFSIQSFATPSIKSELSQAEKLVVDFYERIFVKHHGDVSKIAQQYVHEDYIQHNPWVATGRAAFIEAFSNVVKNRPASKRTEIKRVISAGGYVVLHVHAYDTASTEPGSAGVDIFRVENGKIMEHWDVWQKIPENMPHKNGML